jgi:hypothetical protein
MILYPLFTLALYNFHKYAQAVRHIYELTNQKQEIRWIFHHGIDDILPIPPGAPFPPLSYFPNIEIIIVNEVTRSEALEAIIQAGHAHLMFGASYFLLRICGRILRYHFLHQ